MPSPNGRRVSPEEHTSASSLLQGRGYAGLISLSSVLLKKKDNIGKFQVTSTITAVGEVWLDGDRWTHMVEGEKSFVQTVFRPPRGYAPPPTNNQKHNKVFLKSI